MLRRVQGYSHRLLPSASLYVLLPYISHSHPNPNVSPSSCPTLLFLLACSLPPRSQMFFSSKIWERLLFTSIIAKCSDGEALLSISEPYFHTQQCRKKCHKRNVCLMVKASALTSCVWVIAIIAAWWNFRSEVYVKATDDSCLRHISQYCRYEMP